MVSAAFLKTPNKTYNQMSAQTGFSVGICRRVYTELVSLKKITPYALKVHTTENRMPRKNVNHDIRENVIRCFKNNIDFNITDVAKDSGVSFGACYRIHDDIVKEGTIKTRRVIKTSVASGPPLYDSKRNRKTYTKIEYLIKRPDGTTFKVKGEAALELVSVSEGLSKSTLGNAFQLKRKVRAYEVTTH